MSASPAPGPVRTRRVVGAGVELAVHERGEAGLPTVLLVHGYPDDHAVWDEVAALLERDFHIVAYDVRGAGASTKPRGRAFYTFDLLMRDMTAVLDAVSPDEKVHLVGHDWGSIQAWEAVTTMPERFASFTSMSGPCLDHVAHWVRSSLTSADPAAHLRALGQAARSWYIAVFQTPVLPELSWSGRSGEMIGKVLRRLEGASPDLEAGRYGVDLYRANMLPRLTRPNERRTDVPTQVIVPTGDRYVSPHTVGGLQKWVPDLKLRPVAARHWIPRTHPALVARFVREHIAEVTGGELGAGERRELRRARVGAGRRAFEGDLVVVTGAGSGIGRATALAFTERGATVIAADRDLETARRTAELAGLVGAEKEGPVAHAVAVDVSDAAAMEEFAATVRREHGVPDVVVNNAGIGMAGAFLDHTAEDWRRILDVNLWGVVHGSLLFGRQMAERGTGGHIVNTASAAAFTPSRSMSAYATSKAAVLMLSECMRADLAHLGIGVSAICPGIVDTNITRTSHFVGRSRSEELKTQLKAARAYGLRGYGPEKVAERILTAVRRDRALQPVTPEAHLSYALSRLSPGLMRLAARIDPTG
ncbi:SDR family oxidoreductase [Actinocorallia longicatena]|uniref:SDR family oxidoreductase n=1 Tax=Actinocorallia longicatena TaxID=111803 RepID=A0ABP6Q773_9ACTN